MWFSISEDGMPSGNNIFFRQFSIRVVYSKAMNLIYYVILLWLEMFIQVESCIPLQLGSYFKVLNN